MRGGSTLVAGERCTIEIETTLARPLAADQSVEIWTHFVPEIERPQRHDQAAPACFSCAGDGPAVETFVHPDAAVHGPNTFFPYGCHAGFRLLEAAPAGACFVMRLQHVAIQTYEEPLFDLRGAVRDVPHVAGVSNPIVVRERWDERICWGDLHQHSYHDDGRGVPAASQAHPRSTSCLDFLAATPHQESVIGLPQNALEGISVRRGWDELVAAADAAGGPDLVTFLGSESSSVGRGDNHMTSDGNANPGYHYPDTNGLAAVFAAARTHPAIWRGIRNRRIYAVTADQRIFVSVTVDGQPMGCIVSGAARSRAIRVDVAGTAPLLKVELFRGDERLQTYRPPLNR